MPVPKQLLRTLVALVVTSVLASVPRGRQSALGSAGGAGARSGGEVPGLSAESAFGLMSRLQPAPIVMEHMAQERAV
jgi:hypothetical protein